MLTQRVHCVICERVYETTPEETNICGNHSTAERIAYYSEALPAGMPKEERSEYEAKAQKARSGGKKRKRPKTSKEVCEQPPNPVQDSA